MEIIRAKTAGFCFGVDRAVQMTYDLLAEGRRVATLGPLIHNPQCVEDLRQKGAVVIDSPKAAPAGYEVVIRSHGVADEVYRILESQGVQVHDATCPFVAKIHRIAREETAKGRVLLVAGDCGHPEVQGIVGSAAGEVHTFRDLGELEALSGRFLPDRALSVVAQTTFEVTKWKDCAEFLKKYYTNCVIFDTICNATWARQREAAELSSRCDLMVVVGGRQSSNTQKLVSVCEKHCRTISVETAAELDLSVFFGAERAGVTAGASTPSSIIEEVLNKMSEEIREEEMSFEEMLEASLKPVFRGKKIKGVVTGFSPSEVTVDIGTKHTGFVPVSELSDDPSVKPEDVLKKGDELDLVVMQVNDQEGTVMLSKRRFDSIAGFEEVQKAAEDGSTLEAYIQEEVKGGLVAMVKGIRVFIPASQSTLHRGDDYSHLVKTKVDIKILELNGRRAIGSIRAVLNEANEVLREKFWQEVEIGKKYTGTVKSLTSYGAFVDLGGVDGLVHISELAWNRIKHPSEVVKVGDVIEVYVKDINTETKKVSLGYKKAEDNPWNKLKEEYPIGSEFEAPVVSITKFGAFVRILPGIDGLVHISEISEDRVEKVGDVLSVGQTVRVKLIDVDFEAKRVSLSMKAVPQPEAPVEEAAPAEETAPAEEAAETPVEE